MAARQTGTSTTSKNSTKAHHATHAATATATAKKASKTKSGHTTGKSHASLKSTSSRKSARRSSRKKTSKVRGQQKIDSERAQQIQEALIREHYLTGEATGQWNQASEDAMRKYQADHGWQSKTVPDSRALIKLGLGPSKDHLLNPDSAMTTVPDTPASTSLHASSHSPAPVATTPAPTATTPSAASKPAGDPVAEPASAPQSSGPQK